MFPPDWPWQDLDHLRRGLGAVIVDKFAAEGANVVINYVASKDKAVEVAQKAEKDHGVKTAVLQAVGPPSREIGSAPC